MFGCACGCELCELCVRALLCECVRVCMCLLSCVCVCVSVSLFVVTRKTKKLFTFQQSNQQKAMANSRGASQWNWQKDTHTTEYIYYIWHIVCTYQIARITNTFKERVFINGKLKRLLIMQKSEIFFSLLIQIMQKLQPGEC